MDQGADEKPVGQIIGHRVRELRLQKNWSVSKLARESGRDRTHIASLEAGEHSNPGVDMVFKLADALETTPQYLMGLDYDSGLVVRGLEDLPDNLREVMRIGGGLSSSRQSELRYIARALATAENAEVAALTHDLEVQAELLQGIYNLGGDALLARFFRLAGFPEAIADDVEGLRLRLGF